MDREAKERLLLDLLPQIKALTGKFCRKTNMPYEDMVQEACIVAWKSLETFDESLASVWTYIFGMIRWRLLTLFRRSINPRRKPEGHYTKSLDLADVQVVDHRDDWSQTNFDELTKPCRRRDREIIKAIYVDGFTQAEIGEREGVTHQCIGQIHRRALTAMRARELSK